MKEPPHLRTWASTILSSITKSFRWPEPKKSDVGWTVRCQIFTSRTSDFYSKRSADTLCRGLSGNTVVISGSFCADDWFSWHEWHNSVFVLISLETGTFATLCRLGVRYGGVLSSSYKWEHPLCDASNMASRVVLKSQISPECLMLAFFLFIYNTKERST